VTVCSLSFCFFHSPSAARRASFLGGYTVRSDEELPVIRAAYELVVWLIPKIGKFPRDLRFTLGEWIEGR